MFEEEKEKEKKMGEEDEEETAEKPHVVDLQNPELNYLTFERLYAFFPPYHLLIYASLLFLPPRHSTGADCLAVVQSRRRTGGTARRTRRSWRSSD